MSATNKRYTNEYKFQTLLLRLCGLLTYKREPTAYMLIISGLYISVGTAHYGLAVCFNYKTMDISVLTEIGHWALIFLLLVIIIACLYIERKNASWISRKMTGIERIYEYSWGRWDEETSIRDQTKRKLKILCSIHPILLFLVGILQFVRRGLDSDRGHWEPLFKGWIPFTIDSDLSFALVTVFQCFQGSTFVFYTAVFFTFCIFSFECIVTELKVLRLVLSKPDTIVNEKGVDMNEVLKSCIEHHVALYKYFDKLQSVTSWITLALYFSISVVVCVVGFILTDKSTSVSLKVSFVSVLVPEIVAALIFCMYGQKITDESSALCEAVYEMRWYKLPPRMRKSLVIIMQRTHSPMTLMGGGVKVFNLDTFSEIMSTSYSYMNMLRATRNQE